MEGEWSGAGIQRWGWVPTAGGHGAEGEERGQAADHPRLSRVRRCDTLCVTETETLREGERPGVPMGSWGVCVCVHVYVREKDR